jgi:Xaa-Pro aminopeptidase
MLGPLELNRLLDTLGLDVLFVSTPENVRYLSGFTDGKDGRVVITRTGATLITDGRYTVQAGEQSLIPYEIMARRGELNERLKKYFLGSRIGIEADHLSVALLEGFRQDFGLEFMPTQGAIEQFRKVKTATEIAHIKQAAQLTDLGFGHILAYIKPGVRELDIALELEFFLRKQGAQGVAFGFTVASGERGAMPHGGVSERVIGSGELVTLDFGVTVNGYNSDMTRTVGVGQVSDQLAGLYHAVLEAQNLAVSAVAPGQRGQALDALAREHLVKQGYGEYFSHSLGHGVGLAVHEGPALSVVSEDVLEAHNVVTVEPGVYVPGARRLPH